MSSDELLRLIKIMRREKARISQREAANLAGISTVWWRNVEGGRVQAPTDTLARMCFALDIPPETLRSINENEVADGVDLRFLTEESNNLTLDPAEVHVMKTPDVPINIRRSLLAHLHALREIEDLDPISLDWAATALQRRRRR